VDNAMSAQRKTREVKLHRPSSFIVGKFNDVALQSKSGSTAERDVLALRDHLEKLTIKCDRGESIDRCRLGCVMMFLRTVRASRSNPQVFSADSFSSRVMCEL
jgi:hypothetical protein